MNKPSITLDQLLASVHPEVKQLIADLVITARVRDQALAELTRQRDAARAAVDENKGSPGDDPGEKAGRGVTSSVSTPSPTAHTSAAPRTIEGKR